MTENQIATIIVDASLKIHRTLGPGSLKSVNDVNSTVRTKPTRTEGTHATEIAGYLRGCPT